MSACPTGLGWGVFCTARRGPVTHPLTSEVSLLGPHPGRVALFSGLFPLSEVRCWRSRLLREGELQSENPGEALIAGNVA